MYSPPPGPCFRATNPSRDNGLKSMPISDFQLPICSFSQSATGIWQSAMLLSFRELEAFARALLTILLALFDARVARDQTGLLQCRAQVAVVLHQCPRDAVTNCACLSRRAA